MAIGIIEVIPASQHVNVPLSGTGGGTTYPSCKVLNPNDGVLYVARDRDVPTIGQGAWDWKVPSQSYAALPGPMQSVGMFYLDQSGAGRQGEITVYPSQQHLEEPLFVAVGRALQAQATTLDVTQGAQPANPGAGISRIWSPNDGTLHDLLNSGVDDTLLMINAAQTAKNKTFDVSSNVVVRLGKIGPLGAPAASIGFNPVAAGYASLELIWIARTTDVNEDGVQVQYNGDTGARYYAERLLTAGASSSAAENIGSTTATVGLLPGTNFTASLSGAGRIFIPDASGTTFERDVLCQYGDTLAFTTGNIRTGTITHHWDSVQAIASILIFPSAGSFAVGSTFWLYGYP